MDALITWLTELSQGGILQSLAIAIAILVATAVVSAIVSSLIRRLLTSDAGPLPSSSIIVNIARVVIWAIGLSVMLSSCFGIDVNAIIAALGVTGLAVSLGLQDTLKNLIGGLQITLTKLIEPGDHIVVGGVEGFVQDVNWRQTVVKDLDNNLHYIPNAITNSAELQKIEPSRLVATMLSFVNDTRDLDALIAEMEAAAKEAVEQVAELEKDPWILLTQIGEYGTWAKLRFVLKDTSHAREARDAALRAVSVYTRVNSVELLGDEQAGEGGAAAEGMRAGASAVGGEGARVVEGDA